jgi:hypothetical protein
LTLKNKHFTELHAIKPGQVLAWNLIITNNLSMQKTIILILFVGWALGIPAHGQSSEPRQEALSDTLAIETSADPDIPVILLSSEEIEGDADAYDISSLLQGSRDIYVSTAGFTFGSARYRIRGYDAENTLVMINGLPVNDPETGRAFYSTWGGLNDATRMTVGHSGIGVARESFAPVGGATNIVTRASEYSPTTRITYSNANRSYVHRAMFTHATGMQDNGWALTLSGSRRSAGEGYVKGTFYDAWAYFLSAERRLSDRHSLGFTAFGAPSRTGRPGVATQEVYDLVGDNFYNPNWGYQNGEVRNSRVNHYHTPHLIFSHYWDPSVDTRLTSSLSYAFGRGGSTALNWYDSHASYDDWDFHLAGDPRPDYYRWLPSFHTNDPSMQAHLTGLWQNDEQFRQINWDWLYNANRKNLHAVHNANGSPGNTVTGYRSKYIVEERRNDRNQLQFNTNLVHAPDPTHTLSGGLNVSLAKTHQFKVLEDLLGGEWWLDIDQFAERDFADEDMAQNDLRNPNRLIGEGDRFGYDFTGHINQYSLFVQSEWILPRWDFFVAGTLSQTTFWRTGHMQNARFPDNSFGDSEKQHFTNFGLKGGTTYKLTGRHYFTANAAYMTRAPFFRSAYVSSRVRDHLIDNLQSETILSADISYFIRSPRVKSRLTLFYTDFLDQTWSRSFYHDEFRTFVNYIMTGVDTRHMGVELGIDFQVSPSISSYLVAGTGDYFYNSRPTVTIARDNDFQVVSEQRTVYLQNYKLGGLTHSAASAGLRYDSPQYWFAGINGNIFGDIYIDINPDRRTAEAVQHLVTTDPQWEQMLLQEKLGHGITFDLFAGKSWRIRYDYFININISVSNLLDARNLGIGGFEQLRYDAHEPEKFGSRYFYLYGRTFFANLAFRF